MNNLPKVVTQRCLEQDLNPRPTDRKPKCLTVTSPHHRASTRQIKPIWFLLKQEIVSGIGISWVICNSAPHHRQITTPALHHSGCPGKEAVKRVSAEMEGERILKIGQHLVKSRATV